MKQKLGDSRVTKNFQITIPPEARELLKVRPKEFVEFYVNRETKKILIQRAVLVTKK